MKLALLAGRHSIHTVRWANALADRGHEIHLISLHSDGDPLDKRVRLHLLPCSAPAGYFLNIVRLRRLLRAIQPDLLHAHYASGYGTLGRLSGFRPYVISVWGSDVYDFPYSSPINRWLITANLKAADWVCATSHVMAEQTRSLHNVDNLSVTPFGIDTHTFTFRPELRNPEVITVGTVKTLAPKYGMDILIRAFAEARRTTANSSSDSGINLRLLIVGDGPGREALIALTENLGITDATEFSGRVRYRAVPDYLNRLDIYVAPSRLDSESFGVAVLEASACARPVVVSNVGGLPEVVRDGVTGFVVKREDVQATSEAILRLVRDSNLRRRMGQAGRRHVLEHYEWSDSVSGMEGVYRQVTMKTSVGDRTNRV